MGEVPDVITPIKFYVDRSRGFFFCKNRGFPLTARFRSAIAKILTLTVTLTLTLTVFLTLTLLNLTLTLLTLTLTLTLSLTLGYSGPIPDLGYSGPSPTARVTVTTVLHYPADCDETECNFIDRAAYMQAGLSDRKGVRPSVCHSVNCDKTNESSAEILIPHER